MHFTEALVIMTSSSPFVKCFQAVFMGEHMPANFFRVKCTRFSSSDYPDFLIIFKRWNKDVPTISEHRQ